MTSVNQTVMDKQYRESNFDLLRIFSAFAVIAIHVSGQFVWAMNGPDGLESNYVLNSVLWQVLSRFAVPCFVMMDWNP